ALAAGGDSMISHSQRGGWWRFLTGLVATTRTNAKRPSISSPVGVVRHGSVFQARRGNRFASASTDSGLRSGGATVRGRPTLPLRSGTAKLVSGPYTLVSARTATTYSSSDSARLVRKPASSP